MSLRSFLFVPGDSERKLAKAETTQADALILDLEDAVAPENIDRARGMVKEFLQARRPRGRQQLWVRINPIQTPKALADLAAIMAGGPDGIMLPKADSASEAVTLGHYLSALETRDGLPLESTRILPVATETARAMFALGSYHGASARLFGLTWGAEDLSTAIGASTNRLLDGEYEFTYKLARSLCLLGASAAGVAAIDTIWSNFKDTDGLLADSRAGRRAGFSGKMAIHHSPNTSPGGKPSMLPAPSARKPCSSSGDTVPTAAAHRHARWITPAGCHQGSCAPDGARR